MAQLEWSSEALSGCTGAPYLGATTEAVATYHSDGGPGYLMQKYFFHAPEGNFGDDLNRWIWDEVLPGVWDTTSSLHFSGIGTILGPLMPKRRHWIICGSGTGYGAPSVDLRAPDVFVSSVRGPLTAKVIGLNAEAAVTDGAILLARLPRFHALPETERAGTIFVPHKSALQEANWREAASLAGIELVDPRGDCESVIQRIRHSQLVLADSMHAAIVADALRVRWTAVSTSPEINEFKWLDWTLSLGVPYEPINLPASSWAERRRCRHLASRQPNLQATNQIERALEAYAKHVGRRSGPYGWRQKVQSIGFNRKVTGDLFQGVMNGAARLAGSDQRFIDAAADAIGSVAQRKGILSDGSISRGKLEEFSDRLDAVAKYARAFEDRAKIDAK